jgi:ligand-binding sensor domain-containing protein/signal transduction histidine kinase
MKFSSTHFRKTHRWFRRGLLAGILLLPLLLPGRASALDPSRSLLQYNCRTWNRRAGLPATSINAIAQTKDGYLWFGTSAGLLRFDGTEFKVLDLHSVAALRTSYVTSLASAGSGGLWVGLEHSAFGFYDGQTFSFRGSNVMALDVQSLLESRNGTLWLAAEQEADRWNPTGGLETVLPSAAFTNTTANAKCVYEDREGRVWIGTLNQGAFYWQDGKITQLPAPELKSTTVLCITEDLAGQIWIGTGNGLYCYDASLKRREIPPLPSAVSALLVDRHGVLWIGTSWDGLARYENGKYDYFLKADGLDNDDVQALFEDSEGNLWIGTGGGLDQLSDVKFPIQPATDDPKITDANSVTAARKGGVWIASYGGVVRFDPQTKSYTHEGGLPATFTKRVFEARNGDLYFVCGTTNLVVSSGGKIVATYGAPDLVVAMAEDDQGVVVSVAGKLYRTGTNYFRPYTFKTNAPPDFYWISNLASGKDGVIWVACGNGIFRIKDGLWQHWAGPEGLVDLNVQTVTEDQDGVLWAGLFSGIARLKDNQIRLISRNDGLFDNNIYGIVPDDLGNLWVDSSRGISRVARSDMNAFADGKTNRVACTVFDGLDSVKTTDKTAQERVGCKTADGRIWFPGPLGVVMIDPAHVPVNPVAPPVHIGRVLADGREVARNASIVVPPGNGELEFHFDALSFSAPTKVQIQYRLEGYDQDWVDAGDRRLAYYTNLKPGKYDFQVIAANADGVWNRTGDAINIELRPHYYQTFWFRLLGGVLALAALGGSYAWRIRHLMHKQRSLQKNRELLEAEVANRTRELATANASLQRDEAQLTQKTQALEKEIAERKHMELENERVHRELLAKSRQAGMAEIATNVLHNIGNVLNSVNVSASLVVDNVKQARAASLAKVAAMLREHEQDLGTFITTDAKGRQLPGYLGQLADKMLADQKTTARELDLLLKNIEHIKDVVTMQQSYARVSGVAEMVSIGELVEDGLRMSADALARHNVQVVREFEDVPPINLDKHRILQILVNLIRNAKHACQDSGRAGRRLTVRVTNGEGRIKISVTDNGVGIAPENLARIFSHGFTTRKDGHGFGLHSGALAAKEMGGSLTARSDGPGQGATFTLELPQITTAIGPSEAGANSTVSGGLHE